MKKVLSTKQKDRRKLNKYPHCMSRKGYANLEQEMVSDHLVPLLFFCDTLMLA